MSLLLEARLAARATPGLWASQIAFTLHNSLSNRLLVGMNDSQNRVVKTIFENMRQVRTEHTEASIRQAKVQLYKSQALKNIFNSQRP